MATFVPCTCGTMVEVATLYKHADTCRTPTCPFMCGTKISGASAWPAHVRACPNGAVCAHCDSCVAAFDIEAHERVCAATNGLCRFCHTIVATEALADHEAACGDVRDSATGRTGGANGTNRKWRRASCRTATSPFAAQRSAGTSRNTARTTCTASARCWVRSRGSLARNHRSQWHRRPPAVLHAPRWMSRPLQHCLLAPHGSCGAATRPASSGTSNRRACLHGAPCGCTARATRRASRFLWRVAVRARWAPSTLVSPVPRPS